MEGSTHGIIGSIVDEGLTEFIPDAENSIYLNASLTKSFVEEYTEVFLYSSADREAYLETMAQIMHVANGFPCSHNTLPSNHTIDVPPNRQK